VTIDPQSLRSERFIEIGGLIQSSATTLVDRWCQRAVTEQPNASRVHQAVLRDELIALLVTLGRGLAASNVRDTPQHHLVALEHGEQRWEAGWSLIEVVQDYQLLRMVLIEYLDELLERPLSAREAMAIGLAIDEAIAASVAMYVKFRDESLRLSEDQRLECEREALRRHALELEQAKHRTDEFLSMLAHELRNPLAPIAYAVEAARLTGVSSGLEAQTWDILARQVQQITRLVDDLLDMTRISQGKLQLRKEPTDLKAVVAQAVQSCTPLLQSRGQELSLSLPDEPLEIEADPARLVQVACNLLTNAAKFSEPGRRVWVSAARDANEVVLRVRDEGHGLSPELLPHVFDMYWQFDKTSEQAQGGLGIGLALVRSLVELHGGTIDVTSPGLGQGSEFSVRLPRKDEG
jgi:signal transduction histidine kinase